MNVSSQMTIGQFIHFYSTFLPEGTQGRLQTILFTWKEDQALPPGETKVVLNLHANYWYCIINLFY